MAPPMLRFALRYAGLGWPVLPLRGKVPLISTKSGGAGVYDASTDPEQVWHWWRRFPRANIGIAAGRFWALGIDVRHGGDATLAALEAEHGPLPGTAEQITGTGGRHLLFKANGEPVRNRAGERHHLPPGLDTRANGGYIVVAPSMHPDTGERYRWANGRDLLGCPLAVAPAWLVNLVTRAPLASVSFVSSLPTVPRKITAPSPRYGEAALTREINALRATPQGARNSRLNLAAFSLAQLAANGALNLATAASALAAAGLAAGLAPREVERTLASGFRAGLARPREFGR